MMFDLNKMDNNGIIHHYNFINEYHRYLAAVNLNTATSTVTTPVGLENYRGLETYNNHPILVPNLPNNTNLFASLNLPPVNLNQFPTNLNQLSSNVNLALTQDSPNLAVPKNRNLPVLNLNQFSSNNPLSTSLTPSVQNLNHQIAITKDVQEKNNQQSLTTTVAIKTPIRSTTVTSPNSCKCKCNCSNSSTPTNSKPEGSNTSVSSSSPNDSTPSSLARLSISSSDQSPTIPRAIKKINNVVIEESTNQQNEEADKLNRKIQFTKLLAKEEKAYLKHYNETLPKIKAKIFNSRKTYVSHRLRPVQLNEKICFFCKNNGEPSYLYKTHIVRDPITNKTLCPVLRKYVCELCTATGDQAHTRSYCPLSKLIRENCENPEASKFINMKILTSAYRKKLLSKTDEENDEQAIGTQKINIDRIQKITGIELFGEPKQVILARKLAAAIQAGKDLSEIKMEVEEN